MGNLFKNWRTTLVGVLGGAAQILVLPLHGWKDFIIPIFSVLIGIFAKDGNNLNA